MTEPSHDKCIKCRIFINRFLFPQLTSDGNHFLIVVVFFIIFLRLRADLNPLTPSNSMPNYSAEVLSDEQAQDLYAYIKTLTDNPPEIEDISVLKNILDNANRIN